MIFWNGFDPASLIGRVILPEVESFGAWENLNIDYTRLSYDRY